MASNDNPITNPTYYQNIRPMFTQLDRVMMINYFDLFSYQDVKKQAARFVLVLQPNSDPNLAKLGWSQMQQVHVMPEVPGPWPASWVQTFKNWVANGCPEGTPPVQPEQKPLAPDTLDQFISLTKALTGFDNLGPKANMLAGIYYNRLLNYPGTTGNAQDTIDGVIAAWKANPDVAAIVAKYPIYKAIITIWYTTTTAWDNFGTADFNQYQWGLVWKAGLSHPIGYAPENTPNYWQVAPQADGQYSGYYDNNY